MNTTISWTITTTGTRRNHGQQRSADPSVLLSKISSELLPDNNEGNPTVYRSDWSQRSVGSGTNAVSDNAMSLSKGEYTLDHSGGSTTSDWSVQSDSTKSITFQHGFHFSLTLQGGVKDVFAVGGYANLDYNHGSGHYNTTTKASEASGTVGDIDGPALEAKGIPESVSNAYGFHLELRQVGGRPRRRLPEQRRARREQESPVRRQRPVLRLRREQHLRCRPRR
jgi:hypothetical protein